MKRAVITVTGRVQGVFFRHTARVHAERSGITGWIRNNGDGSVTIIAEGEEDRLETFIAWIKRGPLLSHVENAAVIWEQATGEYRTFEIR